MNDRPKENHTVNDTDKRYALFTQLLVANESQVRWFLRGLLPTWDDVQEVLQTASVVAWSKFDHFEEGTSFGAWLLTIARFEALKYRRGMARSPLIFTDEVWDLVAEEMDDEEYQDERRQHLQACLQKIESVDREILLKVHQTGVVTKGVARELGKSEQAFYKFIQRLRRRLRDCMSQAMATEK